MMPRTPGVSLRSELLPPAHNPCLDWLVSQQTSSFLGHVPRPNYAQAIRRIRSRHDHTPQRPHFRRFAAVGFAYLLFASCVAAAAGTALHARSMPQNVWVPGQVAAPAVTPEYMVLIVLDGARPDYFDMTQLPHLDALRQGGTEFTNVVDGILEAETPS